MIDYIVTDFGSMSMSHVAVPILKNSEASEAEFGPYMKAFNNFYKIKCYETDGTAKYTVPIAYHTGEAGVMERVNQACPTMRYKFKLYNGKKFPYIQNGIDYKILFYEKENFEQFEIENFNITGIDMTFTSETPVEYSPAIHYDTIPYENLRQFSTESQLVVEIDG